jgi:hypothetical protein
MITAVIAVITCAAVASVVAAWRSRQKTQLEVAEVQRDAAIRYVEMVGDYVGGYTQRLKPWWSEQEREAFGYNDNERFIRDTDRILNGIGWERATEPTEVTVLGQVEPIKVVGNSIVSPGFTEWATDVPQPSWKYAEGGRV